MSRSVWMEVSAYLISVRSMRPGRPHPIGVWCIVMGQLYDNITAPPVSPLTVLVWRQSRHSRMDGNSLVNPNGWTLFGVVLTSKDLMIWLFYSTCHSGSILNREQFCSSNSCIYLCFSDPISSLGSVFGLWFV